MTTQQRTTPSSLGATLGLMVTFMSGAANADLSFHGFGQIMAGTTFDDSHTVAQPTNLLYQADPRFDQESLLALQLNTSLSSSISATAQVVARGSNGYQPMFEMAYANVQLASWQLRLGRQRLPLYMHSAYRSVGESYLWARLPQTVYFEPVDDFDGLDMFRTFNLGRGWSMTTQTVYGDFDTHFEFTRSSGSYSATLAGKNMAGSSVDVDYRGWLHFRAEYFAATITASAPPVDQLLSLFREVGLSQAADELDLHDDFTYFRGLGVELTPGRWQLSSEIIEQKTDHSFSPTIRAYYIAGGYRWGKLTTALTWQHAQNSPSGEAISQIPAGAACPSATGQLVPGLCAVYAQQFLASNQDQDRFYELSLRYDVTPDVALKLDYTAYDSGIGGRPSANLVSAGITFDY